MDTQTDNEMETAYIGGLCDFGTPVNPKPYLEGQGDVEIWIMMEITETTILAYQAFR